MVLSAACLSCRTVFHPQPCTDCLGGSAATHLACRRWLALPSVPMLVLEEPTPIVAADRFAWEAATRQDEPSVSMGHSTVIARRLLASGRLAEHLPRSAGVTDRRSPVAASARHLGFARAFGRSSVAGRDVGSGIAPSVRCVLSRICGGRPAIDGETMMGA